MIGARLLRMIINLWPPFLFTGIRVLEMDREFQRVRVRLRRGLLNRNYAGTHFGGSLFAMTDPFWMLLMMQRLGPGYVVWDRAASIDFIQPGRETVYAEFHLSDEEVAAVREASENGEPETRWYETCVTTEGGEVVARVRKQLYIRRKLPQTQAVAAG